MFLTSKNFICVAALVSTASVFAYGQSLGDVAREQREKQAQKKTQPAKKVVTNEDLPQPAEADESTSSSPQSTEPAVNSAEQKPAGQWKEEIQAQKQSVASLQADIDRLSSSIHFAPGNCVRNCVQHNENQQQKQDEVQRMQSNLEQQKRKLEDMQEAARKQGYGNSVYEP